MCTVRAMQTARWLIRMCCAGLALTLCARGADTAFSVTRRPDGIAQGTRAQTLHALAPRTKHPPKVLRLPPGHAHRITVKFRDEAVARMTGENCLSVVECGDLSALEQLAAEHRLLFTPVFSSPERIDELRLRAAQKSGRAQADLNGTMTVQVGKGEVLKIAQALQDLPQVESVDLVSADSPPPPPADIAPLTPSLVSLQTYRGTNSGFGVDFVWALGVKGQGVRLHDCEYGYNPNHEDLVDSGIQNNSRAAIEPNVYTYGWDEHGTAALGISVAGDNGYGMAGMAPECEAHFYSEWTTLGYNRYNAISDAVLAAAEGDVILLEMQASSGGSNYVPAEYDSTVWNLTKTATDAGVIVVAAAGNGNQDLDSSTYSSYMGRGNSGAIIVGAGSADTNHTRMSFSTYGTRVDVQAWGTGVATTGYGTYAKYGSDKNQGYTTTFNGTSSASACAAGVTVLLQSYAKNVLHTTFSPTEMRSHLKAHANAQGSGAGNIGPALALNLAVPALPDRPLSMDVHTSGEGDLALFYWGLPFRTYKIQASTNLAGWVDVSAGLSGSANAVQRTLSGERNAYRTRYYKLVEE